MKTMVSLNPIISICLCVRHRYINLYCALVYWQRIFSESSLSTYSKPFRPTRTRIYLRWSPLKMIFHCPQDTFQPWHLKVISGFLCRESMPVMNTMLLWPDHKLSAKIKLWKNDVVIELLNFFIFIYSCLKLLKIFTFTCDRCFFQNTWKIPKCSCIA